MWLQFEGNENEWYFEDFINCTNHIWQHKRTSREFDFFVYRICYKDPSQTVPCTPLVRLLEMLCNDLETARIGFLWLDHFRKYSTILWLLLNTGFNQGTFKRLNFSVKQNYIYNELVLTNHICYKKTQWFLFHLFPSFAVPYVITYIYIYICYKKTQWFRLHCFRLLQCFMWSIRFAK